MKCFEGGRGVFSRVPRGGSSAILISQTQKPGNPGGPAIYPRSNWGGFPGPKKSRKSWAGPGPIPVGRGAKTAPGRPGPARRAKRSQKEIDNVLFSKKIFFSKKIEKKRISRKKLFSEKSPAVVSPDAHSLLTVCSQSAHSLLPLAASLLTVCSQSAHSLLTVCSRSAHICSQSAHSLLTVCSQSAHGPLTVCSQSGVYCGVY